MSLPPIVGDRIEAITVDAWRALVATVMEKHGSRIPSPTSAVQQLRPPLQPHVLRGRWVVSCPYCDGVTLYAYGTQFWYCLEPACPRPHGAALLEVDEPDAPVCCRAEWLLLHRVEHAIDRRTGQPVRGADGAIVTVPKHENRNWNFHAGETTAQLATENLVHGLRADATHAEFAARQPMPSSAIRHTPRDGLTVQPPPRQSRGGPPAERPAVVGAPRVTHYGPDGTEVAEPGRGATPDPPPPDDKSMPPGGS